MYGILIFLSMAKQVTLTHFFKKPRIEINNYLEDQSVDRNGTTAGSENGAEINSEPTTSTDANRQADLPMANQRSLLHLIATVGSVSSGGTCYPTSSTGIPEYHNWWEISKLQRQVVWKVQLDWI